MAIIALYTIVPCAFDQGDEKGFRIRVYTKGELALKGPRARGQGTLGELC